MRDGEEKWRARCRKLRLKIYDGWKKLLINLKKKITKSVQHTRTVLCCPHSHIISNQSVPVRKNKKKEKIYNHQMFKIITTWN